MNLSTLTTILSAHAKTATAVLAVSAATGGGLAVATTVANSHAAPGLAIAKAAPTATPTPDATDTSSSTGTSTDTTTVTPTSTTSPTQTPVTCANAKNHGAYVSSIAHMKPSPGSAPNAHGKAVSQAAQSSCGKPSGGSSTSGSDSTDRTDSADGADGSGSSGDQSGSGRPAILPSHPGHSKHGGQSSGH